MEFAFSSVKKQFLRDVMRILVNAPEHYFDSVDRALDKAVADGCGERSVALAVAIAEGLEFACEVFECDGEAPPEARRRPDRRRVH